MAAELNMHTLFTATSRILALPLLCSQGCQSMYVHLLPLEQLGR
jgi:hypothetical protein